MSSGDSSYSNSPANRAGQARRSSRGSGDEDDGFTRRAPRRDGSFAREGGQASRPTARFDRSAYASDARRGTAANRGSYASYDAAGSRSTRSASAGRASRDGIGAWEKRPTWENRPRRTTHDDYAAPDSRSDHRDGGRSRQGARDSQANAPRREGGRSRRDALDAQATDAQAKKNRYIPALDGMRTLAVLAVIAYHMGFPWASGGLLGVTMFFVLSGYLITSLLIAEWDRSQTIDLPHFWLRRVRRLVPAIVTVVVVCAALFTVFNHALLTKMRPDILPSLVFFNNWWQIIQDISYFDALGSPSPLTHFWSLAIEEQFYLVWPPLLLVAFKFGASHKIIRRGTLVLALASVLAMVLLYGGPESDPSRVYYGTDTRAFSLLIGAWLAFAWPSAKLGVEGEFKLEGMQLRIMDGIGLAALIGLVAMLATCDGMGAFMYRGGILLASLLTMVVIAVIAHPDSLLAKFFALPPFVWLGVRSYGIYLWHYPILLLMIPVSSTAETPWWLYLIAFLVIIAVSAVSYTFIENPIRKGALGRMASEVAQRVSTWGEIVRSHLIQIACAGVALVVAVGGVIFVPETSALEGADILKQAEEQQSDPTQANIAEPAEDAYTVLLIGDSVSVRAIPHFDQAFPGGHIDAAVNRQLYSGAEVYAFYRDANLVGDVVVFALGTNGQATDEQIDELVNAVGTDKQIYLVNTRSTTTWMDATNTALWNATQRFDNVHLVDWFSYSANRGDLFDGDGTHLTESGAQEYITLIQNTIAQTTGLPEEPSPEEVAARKQEEEALRQKIEQAPSTAIDAAIHAFATASSPHAQDE